MDSKIERELRFLKAYAYASTLAFGVLIFVAAKGPGPGSTKFTEIDAERINIREKDGHLRLAIANTDRMPGGTVAGVDLSYRDGKRDGAGMIFFNDEGDEDGGLVYHGKMVDGKPVAGGTIRFDNYRQNEAIGLSHSQEGDNKESALEVWDQPNVPLTAELVRGLVKVQTMSDGQPKKDAMQALLKEHGTEMGHFTERVFVGRTRHDDAAVLLMDTKGKPRIRMAVDSSNVATLEFLDENGKVLYSLPK